MAVLFLWSASLSPFVFLFIIFIMRFTFPKPEHLCLQRDIDALFTPESQSAVAFPIRMLTREVAHTSPHAPRVQVLVSVSKRKFKHAVDRNRAKRQLREAYRLNKHLLLEALPEGTALHVAFIWIADAPQDSSLVHKRMTTLLQRAADRYHLLSETPEL